MSIIKIPVPIITRNFSLFVQNGLFVVKSNYKGVRVMKKKIEDNICRIFIGHRKECFYGLKIIVVIGTGKEVYHSMGTCKQKCKNIEVYK